ncbi:MAG: ATP-binding cassette domain-containing protein [Oscillospiraceae bacterium]
MIKIDSLTKSFKKTKAVDKFSCVFDSGIYGLLGPNGAGKTTLIRCIANLYNFDSGEISFGEARHKNKKSCCNIGYLPQNFGMFPQLTVYEMMKYFAIEKNISEKEIGPVLDIVGLSNKSHDKISSLSGGMVRRLGIAQAIMGTPDVILLDEPTVGLDPEERIKFKNIISKLKDITVILSTHIVTDVDDICSNVLVMNEGSLIFNGSSENLKKIADQKVYMVSENEKEQITGKYIVQSRTENNNGTFLKVLSSEKQTFEAIPPTLEDGYICCLKNI